MNLNDGVMDITYILQNLENLDSDVNIDVKGVLLNFNSKTFIVSVHNGYPIDKVMINDKIFDDFIICAWCDLILIPYHHSDNKMFIFKEFVKKQMEPEDKYFTDNIRLKYISNTLIQIGHIADNPIIMYNCLKYNENMDHINPGSPIYNEKNKLAGIVSKVINNNNQSDIYCVPVNYILKALSKKDNTKIYTLGEDIDYIDKINNYKIICNKIYCNLHKIYIPVDTYIAVHGDNSTYISIVFNNGRCKRVSLYEINNNLSNNNLLIKNNQLLLSYGLITLLYVLEEYEIIKKIGYKTNNLTWNNYNIVY